LTTDSGRKFTSKEFEEYFLSKDIQQETIAIYCLEQNGITERDNHVIVKMAKSMLYAKNMHLKFWLVQPCNDN
jgi:hypothetical protein